MTRLLVTTPRRVLLVDADTGEHETLREGGGEYYGLTWDDESLALIETNVEKPQTVENHRHYREQAKGCVSWFDETGLLRQSARMLCLPHQIEATQGLVAVADTGRNRICVFTDDGELVAARQFNNMDWDIMPKGQLGSHFNSVHRIGGELLVVAHNHTHPSQLWWLHWPGLRTIAVQDGPQALRWAHNVAAVPGLGLCSLGGMFPGLYSWELAAAMWAPDEEGVLTRGLAMDEAYLYIGRSEWGDRDERAHSDGGLWVVDVRTRQTVRAYTFPGSGCVHEVRIIDGADGAHNGFPFQEGWLDGLRNIRAGSDAQAGQDRVGGGVPDRLVREGGGRRRRVRRTLRSRGLVLPHQPRRR